MMNFLRVWSLVFTVAALPLAGGIAATSPKILTQGVGFEPRLRATVPPAARFTDDEGRGVDFGAYLHRRPVVLLLGYYRCPVLCGVDLNATVKTIDEFPPESRTRDFEFVFVSVNPTDTPMAAAEKKAEYLRRLGWEPAAGRWHFLTGTEGEVANLADAVGFRYRYDAQSRQYVHPSGLVFLTPEGTVSSYLLGIQYPAREFDKALAQARRGDTGPLGDLVSILCFSHNPAAGTIGYYVLVALRVGALLTLAGLAWAVCRRWPRKRISA